MEIGADVVAGAHDVIDTGFLNVGLLPGISDAEAPLIVSTVPFGDHIPGIGGLVIEADRGDRGWFIERPRHAGFRKARGDFRVAGGALGSEGCAGRASDGNNAKKPEAHELEFIRIRAER